MAELATSFLTAQSNIEPSSDDWDNAPTAHDSISKVLVADETLKGWGINPILIGSYGRRVSIRRVYDVDMFCRLDEYPAGLTAQVILQRVHSVLLDKYGKDAVTQEDRSVTVLAPGADGLYVDVVPARESGDFWQIPTDDGDWVETNPVVMTELKEGKNADFDDMYVPCVKLLRQVRRTLLGKAKPGGFAIEMAFYTACDEGLVTPTSSMAELFTAGLEGVSDIFRRIADEGFAIPDPSMPGQAMEFDDDADFDAARDAFYQAATNSRTAYERPEDEAGQAALLLQGVLGGNDDFSDVFPMPTGYDAEGNKTSSDATAGSRTATAGTLRFG